MLLLITNLAGVKCKKLSGELGVSSEAAVISFLANHLQEAEKL